MNEVEKMYELAGVAKPVIKKWYYDGYYEDFSWQSSEEDCTKLLKHFDNSIDKLNNRIQQMKKEENAKYDRYTDSVMTEFGRVEKAYMDYPPFTAEKQLELIKWILKKLNFFSIEMSCNEYACADSWISCYYRDSLEESIANYFNTRWQDLTDAEKQRIKEILE